MMGSCIQLSYLLVGLQLLALSHGAIESDLIKSLPGLAKMPPFKQYSGYLKATDGRMLHYWFVESQNDPARDPVVVWLNGGPGCSSLDGLMSEHGPFLIQDDGKTFKENKYSWNKIANMLYLEAPAGVGFSYKPDKNYTIGDNQVAKDNHAALQYFLIHFREFSKNEFYVTGESYGGIYVPTLSSLLVDDSDFNFKGYAVGNGVTDDNMLGNALMYFGYFHGLWGNSLWNELQTYCCNQKDENNRCKFVTNPDPDCRSAVGAAEEIIYNLNVYNLYASCYHSNASQEFHPAFNPVFHTFRKHPHFIQKYQKLAMLKERLDEVPPCIDATGSTVYLNRQDVRKAIHIPDDLPGWAICSAEVGALYHREYDTMRAQYLKVLATKKHRILVYNGDVDMACNFLGDEWFVDSLKQEVVKGYTAWHVTDARGFKQVAGFVKQFENINFVTVKGSGHMVPQDKPQQAFVMFQKFLKNESY